MIVFTIVFGQLAKLPPNGVPYPIWYFRDAALAIFVNALQNAATAAQQCQLTSVSALDCAWQRSDC